MASYNIRRPPTSDRAAHPAHPAAFPRPLPGSARPPRHHGPKARRPDWLPFANFSVTGCVAHHPRLGQRAPE